MTDKDTGIIVGNVMPETGIARKKKRSAWLLFLALVKNDLYVLGENIAAVFLGISHSEGLFSFVCSAVFIFNCIQFVLFRPRMRLSLWITIMVTLGWGLLGLFQCVTMGITTAPFYFFIFCFDVVLWTCIVYTEDSFDYFYSYFGQYFFWFGLGSILCVFGSLLFTGQVHSVGAISYQRISYASAFSFGMILFYYLKSDWFKQKYKYAWCLLPLLFVATILPGGRGAFVLLGVYLLWGGGILLRRLNQIKFKKVFNPVHFFIGIIIFTVVLFFIFNSLYEYIDILIQGFSRAISFIDFQTMSLDLEGGSSGRGPIYRLALDKIAQRPITGYGIYGYLYIDGLGLYPHNIILEIFLQYGILIGFAIIVLLIVSELRFLKEKNDFILLGICFYVYVSLMFSGSYTSNSFFWLLLIFSLARVQNQKKMVKGF